MSIQDKFSLCHVKLVSHRSLSMGDQISLLKGATFEMMQIRFNMVFNSKTSNWECGHITYCIDDAVRGEATFTNTNRQADIYR